MRSIVDAYGGSRWEALDFTGSVASSYGADYSVMQSLQQADDFRGWGIFRLRPMVRRSSLRWQANQAICFTKLNKSALNYRLNTAAQDPALRSNRHDGACEPLLGAHLVDGLLVAARDLLDSAEVALDPVQ